MVIKERDKRIAGKVKGMIEVPEVQYVICNELLAGVGLDAVEVAAYLSDYLGRDIRVELAPHILGKNIREITAAERRAMYEHAKANGTEYDALHWLLAGGKDVFGDFEPWLTSPNAGQRIQTANYFREEQRLLYDIRGGKPKGVMIVGSPKQRNIPEGMNHQQAELFAYNTVSRALEGTDNLDVVLAMEMLTRKETDFCITPQRVMALVQRVNHPRFLAMVDYKAYQGSGIRPAVGIANMPAKYLRRIHANDPSLHLPGFSDNGYGAEDVLDPEFEMKELLRKYVEEGLDPAQCRVSLEGFKLPEGFDPREAYKLSLDYLIAAEGKARTVLMEELTRQS